jgi:hypothetical protein
VEDITPEDSVVPVYLVPLTTEELAEREQFAADEEARKAELVAAENARQEARNSALIKLATLGLTEEEARAVIGL